MFELCLGAGIGWDLVCYLILIGCLDWSLCIMFALGWVGFRCCLLGFEVLKVVGDFCWFAVFCLSCCLCLYVN